MIKEIVRKGLEGIEIIKLNEIKKLEETESKSRKLEIKIRTARINEGLGKFQMNMLKKMK